jgi:hypothetical protein
MLNLKWVSVVQNDYIIENIHSLFLLNCQFCRKKLFLYICRFQNIYCRERNR